jgi:hypothetical protein
VSRSVSPAPPIRRRVDRTLNPNPGATLGWSSPWVRTKPVPIAVPARTQAVAQRRSRVALLVEEEGLERGAITRIAGWLNVSTSTIGRDIRALLAAGNPIVTSAIARANRRKSQHQVAGSH